MRPSFPEFANQNLLFFHSVSEMQGERERKTIYSMRVTDPSKPGQPVAELGTEGKDGASEGAQDVAIWRGSGEIQAVSFGPVEKDGKTYFIPRVENLTDEGAPKGKPKMFEMGTNEEGKAITSCHHPAWNYAGNQIMCIVHDLRERIEIGRAHV